MSYVLTPYLIDLPTLRSAVGGKDEVLINAIRDRDVEKFDDDSSGFSFGQAVTQLVMGQELDGPESETHQYGYALEALSDQIGTVELPDLWGGVHGGVLSETNVYNVLSQSGPPIELPKNPDDFPMIGHLERGRIQALVQQMGDAGLTNPDPELQDLLKEFEGWLRLAAKENKDLVLFYC